MHFSQKNKNLLMGLGLQRVGEGKKSFRYLKKESLPGRSDSKGWHRMNYKGLGLECGNVLPNRINNALPKTKRILKELEKNKRYFECNNLRLDQLDQQPYTNRE